MEIIRSEDITSYELPNEINYKNVIYYSHHAKEVKGTVKNKAKKFVELGLIDWDPDMKAFYCNPIPGYNKSRYKIEKIENEFECDCQFNTTTHRMCSHILAVYLFLKILNWKK